MLAQPSDTITFLGMVINRLHQLANNVRPLRT